MGLFCGEGCVLGDPNLNLNLNRLSLIHPCDGRTNGQTDGHDIQRATVTFIRQWRQRTHSFKKQNGQKTDRLT